MNTIFLADVWDALTRNELALGVLLIIGGLTAYILVITAIGKTREFFGRKPPFDQDLAAHAKSVEQIKQELAGLPTNEKLNELVAKLGNFATLTQLAEIKVGCGEDLSRLERYAHERIHELAGYISDLQGSSLLRAERLSAIESETKTHTRWLTGIDSKIDRLTEGLGIQKGRTERRS